MEAVFLTFILMLSIFLGFELINKVPATLHTPLMSGANAISGVVIIGAIIKKADSHPSEVNVLTVDQVQAPERRSFVGQAGEGQVLAALEAEQPWATVSAVPRPVVSSLREMDCCTPSVRWLKRPT